MHLRAHNQHKLRMRKIVVWLLLVTFARKTNRLKIIFYIHIYTHIDRYTPHFAKRSNIALKTPYNYIICVCRTYNLLIFELVRHNNTIFFENL